VTAAGLPLTLSAAPAVGPTDLATLFAELGPAVSGYLGACGCGAVEDVLGEVFVRVAKALPRFEGSSAGLRSWVFTIAYRCMVDQHRWVRRQQRLLRRLPGPAAAPAPAEPLDPELVRALSSLTPEQRQVITLRFVADLSLQEVADITGKPVGSVKSLQRRGLDALKAALAPQ